MKKLFGVGKKKAPKEEAPPPPSLSECSDNVSSPLTLDGLWNFEATGKSERLQ